MRLLDCDFNRPTSCTTRSRPNKTKTNKQYTSAGSWVWALLPILVAWSCPLLFARLVVLPFINSLSFVFCRSSRMDGWMDGSTVHFSVGSSSSSPCSQTQKTFLFCIFYLDSSKERRRKHTSTARRRRIFLLRYFSFVNGFLNLFSCY